MSKFIISRRTNRMHNEQEQVDKMKRIFINGIFALVLIVLSAYLLDMKAANDPLLPSTYRVFPEQDKAWEEKKKKTLADELQKQQSKGYAEDYAAALLREYHKTNGKDAFMREVKKP